MPTCDYCEKAFPGEEAYLDHLAAAHQNELGRIDSHRVRRYREARTSGVSRIAVAVGAVVALALLVGGGYALAGGTAVFESGGDAPFQGGDGGDGSAEAAAAPTPHDLRSVHYHGTIEVIVDGQRVDFSRDGYQHRERFFHFEGGEGRQWHGHARGITFETAMATLGIGVTENSVTYGGTTYADDENARVSVTVNGDVVTPRTYPLQKGDDIRIVVESN